ncbi:hypothetical protein MTO96_018382 [Rhipicephalus appendiculatus]
MLAKHKLTKRILGHFQLTYATFAPTPALANDKGRLQMLFDDLMEIGRNFVNATSEEAAVDDSEVLVLTPHDLPKAAMSTEYKTWDAALRRYFNETFDNVASMTIARPKYFKALFWALAHYGAPQDAGRVRLGARAAHEKRCIVHTYAAFRFAINVEQWLHVPEGTLNDITDMADEIWHALGELLSDDDRTLLGSRVPPPKDAYLAAIFKHRSVSKPDRLTAFYAVVPALTMKPLYNYVAVKSSLAAHMRDPEFKDMAWARHLEITARIQGYSLLPRELVFPWWETGAPYAVALGGLGVRMAATLYFQMLAKHPNGNQTNEANFQCLAPTAKEDADVVGDIPAAAAALRVVWKAWEMAKARNSSLEMRLGPAHSDAVVFAFHCYYSCGRDPYNELLCNVPLMHSYDFARHYKCGKGDHMNPEKKCNITT